jgi:choline-sulfatase
MATPNILFIMADQLSARCTGATYGHALVQTPHLDALAAQGTVFDSAYCNSPICGPSRASLCTGRHIDAIGAWDNGTDFAASQPTFLHHLRRAGYETLLSGKMHFVGPDQLHGFERRLTPEIYPSSFSWTPDWRRGAYANPGTAVDQLRETGVCDWGLQLDYDEEVSFRALQALRDVARRQDEGRPFFLCASYTHPHDPFTITPPWWELYDHDDIDMPRVPPRTLKQMHPYNQWLQIHHMIDQYPPEAEWVLNARHAYYGMVSYFDHQVGRLVGELERLGLAQNTVVVVTSDHGEMLGEHGMWFKRTYFDPATRVPLIASGPGIQPQARRSETVSLVDLAPTFLESAGVSDLQEIGETLDGCSLVPLLRGEHTDWKDLAISDYCSEGACQPMRMAAGGGWKYVYVHDEPAQLFELTTDPDELIDRVDDPTAAVALSRLREAAHDDWDPATIRQRVLDSQQCRRWINESWQAGDAPAWDVQPSQDARSQYVRQQDAQETARRRRWPVWRESGNDTE